MAGEVAPSDLECKIIKQVEVRQTLEIVLIYIYAH